MVNVATTRKIKYLKDFNLANNMPGEISAIILLLFFQKISIVYTLDFHFNLNRFRDIGQW